MRKVALGQLRIFLKDAHMALGMSREHAEKVSDVFMRATLRGVGHHDIYDLPGRLKAFKNGDVNVNASFTQLSKYEAMESYDGDNGSGELACAFITERAGELAQQYGLGLKEQTQKGHTCEI
jgi:LDH2 family malate/lactate/ureidoglycolate dehydrogenase